MTYVIAQPCVDLKDRACVDECPVDCIYEGKRMLYIHPDECVDCGACEPVCPVEAIFYEDDTPEEWKDYYTANVDFFDDLGSPGGAAKMGEIDNDHPFIAALPPQSTGRVIPDRQVSARLPDFPWDHLTPYAERARAHADGIVDLSVGTPVDPTPAVVQEALRAAADAPGYPLTIGLPETRQACLDWLARRHGVTGLGLDAVLPVIGSKELIASLPTHLGLGAGGPGRLPGARLPDVRGRRRARRSPGGRHRLADLARPRDAGAALAQLAVEPDRPGAAGRAPEKVVDWCRERGALLVSDECYLECAWEAEPVSVLHPDVCGGSPRRDPRGALAVEAVQPRRLPLRVRRRRPGLVGELLAVRKNLGLMMPGPQQVAMVAALDDDAHVAEQHARYAARRAKLREAFDAARVPDRPLRGVALPVGHPRRGLLGDRRVARRARHPGRSRRVLRLGRQASTSGSRSPPPTSGSTRPSPASPRPGCCATTAWRNNDAGPLCCS